MVVILCLVTGASSLYRHSRSRQRVMRFQRVGKNKEGALWVRPRVFVRTWRRAYTARRSCCRRGLLPIMGHARSSYISSFRTGRDRSAFSTATPCWRPFSTTRRRRCVSRALIRCSVACATFIAHAPPGFLGFQDCRFFI